jgi:hypothetical protein
LHLTASPATPGADRLRPDAHGRLIESQLFQVHPFDPLTIAAMAGALSSPALLDSIAFH